MSLLTLLRRTALRRSALVLAATAGLVAPVTATASPAQAEHGHHHGHHRHHGYVQTNLVSSVPGMAALLDANLKDPWGVSFGPQTPLWTANQATSTSTLYAGASATTPGVTKIPSNDAPLVVTFPGSPAGPTGTVFNGTTAFKLPDGSASRFLFDTLDGKLFAWGGGVPATQVAAVPGASFTGLALAETRSGPVLYAADFGKGVIRVFDGTFRQIRVIRGKHVPAGLLPYNVQVLGKRLYVTWAHLPGATAATSGAVDVYTLGGRFVRRLIVGGRLDAPWGLAIAPRHWGEFSRDLLVGNVDDGRINAYDVRSGRFRGTVADVHGKPLANDGLWGIAFGNGVIGTPQTLIIAAGINGYADGLVAAIVPARHHRYDD